MNRWPGGIRKSPSETAWPKRWITRFPFANVWAFIQRTPTGCTAMQKSARVRGDHRLPWPSGRGPRGRWLALSALCRNHRRRENAPTAARLGEARTPLTAPWSSCRQRAGRSPRHIGRCFIHLQSYFCIVLQKLYIAKFILDGCRAALPLW